MMRHAGGRRVRDRVSKTKLDLRGCGLVAAVIGALLSFSNRSDNEHDWPIAIVLTWIALVLADRRTHD